MPIKDFQVSCKNCNLDTICLPRGLSRQEVYDLSLIVKNNSVIQKGEYIYRQKDAFQGIIAIKSGAAKLVTTDDKGNEHILNILLPGELIGFDGVGNNIHSCSAIALDVIGYCEVSANKVDALCQKVPGIARELLKHSCESIDQGHNQIVASKRSAEEKLAIFLMSLSDRLKKRGFSSAAFNIPLTRQEIGNHLGLTLETVSRTLQQFQNDKLIKVQRKYIEINDLKIMRSVYSSNSNPVTVVR